ncbi:MAG: adenylate/guanylate cyclase domain-containing protein [Spirochaetales bacterium]|nr:adenylate/guanylate cyclase domain-containing protein [Spirochaetales bacterium]
MANERKSKLSAIMFTDILGYSRIMEGNEHDALSLLDTHNQIIFPLVEEFNGKIVKTIGDAMLIDFSSALDAANCAVNVQKALANHNLQVEKPKKIFVRIGIHIGDVWYTDTDIFGDSVTIAAGLQLLSLPGGICISKEMYNLLANKINVKVTALGPQRLAKITKTIDVYRIQTGTEVNVPDVPEEKTRLHRKLDTLLENEKAGTTTKNRGLHNQAGTDPGELIKTRIFSTIEHFMDSAVNEWNKIPREKKDMFAMKMKNASWFHDLEHKKRISRKHRGSKKSANEEIAVGIAAALGFGAALFITKLWFLIFPFMFVGLIPLFVGISKLFKEKRLPENQTGHVTAADKEKEILKVAKELGGKLTVLQVASRTSLSIEDARTTLDAMVKKGYVQLNVPDSGILQYEIPEFFLEPETDDVSKQIDELGD